MHAVFSTLTFGLERFIWIKSCCGYGHSSKLKSAQECATQGERYEEWYFYCFFHNCTRFGRALGRYVFKSLVSYWCENTLRNV